MVWRKKRSGPEPYIPAEVQRAIRERLHRIQGHVRGVEAMLDERRPCDEILIQLSAIRSALAQVGIVLTGSHLEVCVAQALRSGDSERFVAMFKDSLVQFMKQC